LSLDFFLASLTGKARPRLHRPRWRELLGAPELALLERCGWLHNDGSESWYPCGGACSESNTRFVHPEPTEDNLWRVVCPTFECLEEEVPPCELEVLAAESGVLARWLREHLRASGVPLRFERSGLHGLGRVPWQDAVREGVLVTGVAPPSLPPVLRELRDVASFSVVFVPEIQRLPAELRGAHNARSPVTLVGLDELLELRGGQLDLRRSTMGVREPPAPPYQASPVMARVHDASGQRELTRSAYDTLVSQRASFDLFLDQIQPGPGRDFLALSRDATGEAKEVRLSANELAVLIELVQAQRPLRLGEFKSVEVQALGRLIERARGKIEGKAGRGGWRLFKTLAGVEEGAQRYVFQPPAGFRFAVVVPLGE
jgi:hypothetical protein